MDGDKSDNIDGVKGAGLTTLKKYIPIMTESKKLSVDDLIHYSENPPKRYAIHEKIVAAKDVVERNFRLMQLSEPDFASSIQINIQECVSKPIQKIKMIDITRRMTEDGIHNNMPNYHIWLRETFSILDHFAS
jgi:5'-3' exonuclease